MLEVLNAREIAYGFIQQVSAEIDGVDIGKGLGVIFLALNDYEDYIDKMSKEQEE